MDKEIRNSTKVVLSELAEDLGLRASKLRSLGKFEAADILSVLASKVRKDSSVLPRVSHLRQIFGFRQDH